MTDSNDGNALARSKPENTRGRVYTTGSIEEYLKRKRRETEHEEDKSPPQSKKTAKSISEASKEKETTENKERNQDIQELTKMITGMFQQLKDEIKCNNDQLKKNSEDIANLREEIIKREEDWKRERESWVEERETLNKRIQILESKIERQERAEKRNNLILRGADLNLDQDGEQELQSAVAGLIRKELNIDAHIERAYKIGKSQVVVKLNTFENKLQILRAKPKLSGKNIYI
ncbi:hypothetical protein QE152_g23117 [Popillia japonica]|uniref:Uncharacterized protein n=1 Tax=Popillia japonica TaxID=7064 RepID=A0AAW1KGF5_POPJA